MSQEDPANLLTVKLHLGRLVRTCNASHGVYHVYDSKTSTIRAMRMQRAKPSRRERFAATLRKAVPVVGGAAFALSAVIGAQYYSQRGAKQPLPPPVAAKNPDAALAVATPASAPALGTVNVVQAAYGGPDAASTDTPLLPIGPQLAVYSPAVLPVAAPASPSAPAPSAATRAEKSSGTASKADAKAGDVGPVVMNEEAPKAAKSETAQAVRVTNTPAAPTVASRPPATPAAATPKTRLVAVQDSRTIFISQPGSKLPARLGVGESLPDGKKLVKVDPDKGVALFEGGVSLRLE